jgi:hypothetical protein
MRAAPSVAVALVLVLTQASARAAQDPAAAPPTTPPPQSGGQGVSLGTTMAAAPALKGISVWGILPWGGIGLGARFMLPLNINPLLAGANTTIRDSFALEFGADLLTWGHTTLNHDWSWTELLPVGGIMWNVWLTDQLAVYPKGELGYAIGWESGWDDAYGTRASYGGFFWDIALGAMFKLNNGITLRAEAGYAGLKLGAGFLF